jgi:hypothetical protein
MVIRDLRTVRSPLPQAVEDVTHARPRRGQQVEPGGAHAPVYDDGLGGSMVNAAQRF